MLIDIMDTRRHQFPEGWRPIEHDPCYTSTVEVWICERDN